MENMQILNFSEGSVEIPNISDINEAQLCDKVLEGFTPYVGQEFASIDEAASFYRIYAVACGFDMKRYTEKKWKDGSTKMKLIVCNREGKYRPKNKSSKLDDSGEPKSRRRRIRATGCKAGMELFALNGVLKVAKFERRHNHELISVEKREFQKLSNNLSEYHKSFIVSNFRLNIGATRTYRMNKEYFNGFENVGASLNSFRNFQRDIKCFIHERDGQLFIDRFKEMEENRDGFYFDYDVDDDGSLRRAIWVDGVAKRNYELFGDAVSFDPTYSTNKYSMVFTPFTGVDNHKKSVTFCAALIAKEDFDSFNWVFSRFLSAMGGKEPEYIITDQDPGIIKSVSHVFKRSRHRFCMWHIMNKVPTKFGTTRTDYKDFLAKLNSLIWNDDIDAAEFDQLWYGIMEEHGVGHDDWFQELFAIRKQWVLAHCKDLRMGALLRTTQRSESSNSFFKRFEHKTGTLVEFWMRFESAMDQQRHTKKKLDNEDKHSEPQLITKLKIEEDGSKVYSFEIFLEFQEEVNCSISKCSCRGYKEESGEEISRVKDSGNGRFYDVHYNPDTKGARCTCALFERKGILCKHIIWILTTNGVDKIPSCGISRRWMKDCLLINNASISMMDVDSTSNCNVRQLEMSKLSTEINETVRFLQSADLKYVGELCDKLRQFREEHTSNNETPTLTKDQEFEKLLGCKVSNEISIMPPKQSKNKGSGKRMMSNKNIAIAVSGKQKRLCKNCKQMAHHDKRNCPNPYVEKAPLPNESTDGLDVIGDGV